MNKRLERNMYFDIPSFEEIIIAINSSTFVENSALLGLGGALHIKGVDLNIGFSIFQNNSALGGGSVCSKSDNNVDLQISNFLYNHANSKGGAVLLFAYHVTLSQCILRGNVKNNVHFDRKLHFRVLHNADFIASAEHWFQLKVTNI